MAKRSERSRTAGKPKQTPASVSCLYLGCFTFDEPGEPEHTGSFQIVVEAASPEQAVARFRSRLRTLRTSTTLFDNPVTIFNEGILKLTGSFKNGLLVNWGSGDLPPPPSARLTCLIPEQDDHEVEEFSLSPSKKAKRGEAAVEPFLDFGGERLRRTLDEAKAKTAPTSSARSVLPAIPTLPGGPKSDPRPSKEAARAEALAQKRKREALAVTLDELRGGTSTSRTTKRAKPTP